MTPKFRPTPFLTTPLLVLLLPLEVEAPQPPPPLPPPPDAAVAAAADGNAVVAGRASSCMAPGFENLEFTDD